MTPWQWWVGVGVVALAILAHGTSAQLLPRYQVTVEPGEVQHFDRWTGRVTVRDAGGREYTFDP